MGSKHIAGSGTKAGQWVTCDAKQACRNGGQHITSEKLKEISEKTYTPIKDLTEADVDAYNAQNSAPAPESLLAKLMRLQPASTQPNTSPATPKSPTTKDKNAAEQPPTTTAKASSTATENQHAPPKATNNKPPNTSKTANPTATTTNQPKSHNTKTAPQPSGTSPTAKNTETAANQPSSKVTPTQDTSKTTTTPTTNSKEPKKATNQRNPMTQQEELATYLGTTTDQLTQGDINMLQELGL